ncbi:MAG: iron ABC transporter permease [Alphaproteobacteria bacterium]|nr:iron ABC transporter permease [Alphaproteobacteria bacterium]
MSRFSGGLAALAIGIVFGLFILVPIGAVLLESVRVQRPVAPAEMRARTVAALDLMEADRRAAVVTRWVQTLNPRQRMEVTAATLAALGLLVTWDRQAAFDEQIVAATGAVERLTPEQRTRFEAEFPVQTVVVHRRIPLAFQLRDRLDPAEFEALRSGVRTGFGIDHLAAFLTEQRFQRIARNSILLALVTSALTVLIAYALAYAVTRGDLRWPGPVRAAALVPLVSPPVIIAFAIILLFGRQGLITKGLLGDMLGLVNPEQFNVYGFGGVVAAQVLSFLPHAYIVIENVLSQHDGRLEEAAVSQGATSSQVFRHVTLPMTMPGVTRALLLVAILSMTDFGNPLVIGRDYPVLAGAIYDEILGFQNKPLAAALCLWLMVPTIGAYWLAERIGRRRRHAAVGGTGGPPELLMEPALRGALSVFSGLVVAFVALLYLTVVYGSFTRVWGIDFSLTLEHYLFDPSLDTGLQAERGIPTVWTSIKIAAVAAPIGGVLSLLVAYLAERVRPPGAEALAFLALLPAILPGVILGIGYLIFFNAPFGFVDLAITGTAAILIVNVLFANLYVGVLAGRAALQRLDAATDEAASVLGATMVQSFRLVTLPMLRRTLVLSMLYVFIHGLTTLSAVIFLVSPDHKLASVGVFLNAEASHYGLACSTSVVILATVLVALSVGRAVDRPSRRTGVRQQLQVEALPAAATAR